MSRPGGSDRQYVERLGDALRTRDPNALRAFLVDSAGRFGDAAQVDDVTRQTPEKFEALMHQMTVVRADLAEFHDESRRWLAEHGLPPPTGETQRRN
ncbi:MAG: hypothetical protein GEU73_13725 [Chloroflexi bacterium]|nr:hypothetical protein [Chloroflexota bacterium]